jgi:hypothetical protein
MVLTITDERVSVTLSRRNLRQLDGLLETTDGRNQCLVRRGESGVLLVVRVEDDADHYDCAESPRPRLS